jgi:hypothetical protein
MNDKKPDYAGFMKKPSAPRSKTSRASNDSPQRDSSLLEEDIPWAEIITEPEDPLEYSADPKWFSGIPSFSAGLEREPTPPIAVLMLVVLVVLLFLVQ